MDNRFASLSECKSGSIEKLDRSGIGKADTVEKLELPDIAEKAETFTVLVGCWGLKRSA